jgi:hypothetical protein
MPVITFCPKCNRKIRVADDLLNQRVRCPQCNAAFVVDQADAGIQTAPGLGPGTMPLRPSRDRSRDDEDEDEDEDDRLPRRRRRRRRPAGGTAAEWMKVRFGLTFILASVGVSLLGFLVCGVGVLATGSGAFGMFSSVAQNRPVGEEHAMAVGGGLLLMGGACAIFLVSWGLSLTGQVFCLFAPPAHGARVLAIISLSLTGLVVALALFGGLLGSLGPRTVQYQLSSSSNMSAPPPPVVTPAAGAGSDLSGVRGLIQFAQWIVFLFFLRAVAQGVRRPELARGVVALVISIGVGVAASFVLFCGGVALAGTLLLTALRNQDPSAVWQQAGGTAVVALIVGGLIVMVWLGLWIWYVILMFQVREGIGRYLARA